MDIWSKEKRSDVMSRIKGKNTTPELIVRSMLHRMGYRFRIHRRDLPGSPDIVLPKYKSVIFIHGCFWHQHKGCSNSTMPKSRRKKWMDKLEGNVKRDKLNMNKLKKSGWSILVIWECETEKKLQLVERRLLKFLTFRHVI